MKILDVIGAKEDGEGTNVHDAISLIGITGEAKGKGVMRTKGGLDINGVLDVGGHFIVYDVARGRGVSGHPGTPQLGQARRENNPRGWLAFWPPPGWPGWGLLAFGLGCCGLFSAVLAPAGLASLGAVLSGSWAASARASSTAISSGSWRCLRVCRHQFGVSQPGDIMDRSAWLRRSTLRGLCRSRGFRPGTVDIGVGTDVTEVSDKIKG